MDEEEEDAVYNSEEGDETVTLSEIVSGREVILREEELWALCRECCLTLEFVHSTQELFQSLVITPETVAFDREGNVCFLDLDADPEPLYIPPELVEDGCSYESHLYSLGMTLLFAVEYSGGPEGQDAKSALSQDLTDLLTHLTQDNPGNRPDLELVLEYCDRALQDASSQEVCQRFACVPAEEEHENPEGAEKGTSLRSMTEELTAYLQNQTGLVTPAQRASNSNSDTDSSKQLSNSRQQASSAETQAVESTSGDDQPGQKKESENSNPKSPGIEISHSSTGEDNSLLSPRKSRRRQGMLLSDILDALDRYLQEAELWALCRECIISLQRKKKHLPAYISPDTVMIREIGSVSFKAIPEDKPLEVMFMAPELQQKGILNEQTCLFGLGVTLRAASGEKHDSSELDAIQELIATLVEADSDYRPSLEVALMACEEFEKQSSIDSRSACHEIYMDACALMSSREPKKCEAPSLENDSEATLAELQTTWTELDDTEREGVFLEDGMEAAEEEPSHTDTAKTSAFHPIHAKQPAPTAITGSAFKPVPTKPKAGVASSGDLGSSRPRYPSAFSSPATHFKPIILQASAPQAGNQAGDQATGEVLEEVEKEKNVMRKLKEIKKNLLKHRPPGSLSKDVEVDDGKPPVPEKPKTPRTTSSSRSSRKSSGAGETSGALESFLQHLQSSGQMPDTQNLALAIAQHLQAQMGSGGEAKSDGAKPAVSASHSSQQTVDNAISVKSSVGGSQPGVPTAQVSGVDAKPPQQNSGLISPPATSTGAVPAHDSHTAMSQQVASSVPVSQLAGPIPAMSMAGMTQPGYMDQSLPMPVMPFSGGVMPGPVQYQLQQDPRTGLLQLFPVPVLPYGAQPCAPRSPRTPGSDHAYNPWQQPVTVSPGAGLIADYSVDSEDTGYRNASRSNASSRNARSLIQKTAVQRAKNAASASTSPTGYLSDNGANLPKSTPYLEDDSLPDSSSVRRRDSSRHRRSNSSGACVLQDNRVQGVRDTSEGAIRTEDFQVGKVDYSGAGYPNSRTKERNMSAHSNNTPHRSVSQSSSPSPSKDSGICVTHNSLLASQVSSASLMERLLSSESLRHQQTVTQVLHILNQGFGDHGPDSFHSEEILAEYVVSLAHLKWDTFMHAVTEKYSNLFWSHTLLVNLYHAVNERSSAKSSTKIPPVSRSRPYDYSDQEALPQLQKPQVDSHNRRRSVAGFAGREGEEEGGEPPPVYREGVQGAESDQKQKGHRDKAQRQAKEREDSGNAPSLVRVMTNGRYISGRSETSDSTDNEQEEKRRRFKKRYELDRAKSTSLHSIPGTAKFSLPPEQREYGSEQRDSSGSRPVLYNQMSQPEASYDVKMLDNRNRREVGLSDSSGRYVQSEMNASPLPRGYSPSSFNSLPRAPKPSQPLPPPYSRADARDAVSPSWSGAARLNSSYPGVDGRGPHSDASGARTAVSPGVTRPYPGAVSHSQSSHQHVQGSGVGRDSRQQRPDSQDYRDSPSQQHQADSRGPHRQLSPSQSHPPNLNTSGGSYSPAFSQSSKDNSSGYLHPDQARASRSSSILESQGFVYGQHREPMGKPPSSASPKILKNLTNTHSHLDNTKGEPVNKRASLPLRTSPGRAEINNNARKLANGGRDVKSMVGLPKNHERSPVRRTQHKAKPQLAWDQEIAEYRKKGQVVYHSAMIQLSMTAEVDRFIHDVDKDNKASITSKLASVEQELTMQRRQRRKSQTFYKKLTEPGAKQPKGENKSVVNQVLKDMSEMTGKLRFLELCRTHLQMMLAELYGLDTCFLHTLVTSGSGGEEGGVGEPQPLVLQPYLENRLLQFQTVREVTTGCEVQVLQAGHPQGLLSYLFSLSALSDGYIHQFLFCFRYFVKADDVFTFITQTFISARKGNQSDVNIVRAQQRAFDLLQFWVEGYYSLDFERNESLLDQLEAFIMQRVEEGKDGSQNLMNLLYACHLGENTELVSQADDSDDHDEVYYLHLASPKRWESFRSLIGRKKSEGFAKPTAKKEGPGMPYKDKGGVLVEKRPPSRADEGSTMSLSRRMDSTQLMDYSPHRLAEQLTLMEQELFQRTHPVHYLDSKAQGVGVDLSIPSLRTPSMARKSHPVSQSLFVGPQYFESRVSDMITHSQEITHWVSAEILCCGSQKSQVSTIGKFLATAQLCVDIRNYATALAVTAGLDNLLVRQLPAWKNMPAKAAVLMDDLEALQVKVKGEPMALMQDKDSHMYPTIPGTLYFLLHLQQLEIGGFTLANGMYKWQKMRSICQMIDQIRIFREHEYGFEPDYELQSLIGRRLHELSDRDLHTVAAAHDNNFRRAVSNTAGIQGTWRKVKVKLQSRNK
ncbi:uncharacterized protein [Littorina saxatilis]|uniref:Protein very KIND-like n=1 Tax=Littorina saxatilis TaxID=31220 RepID=A0AAN9GID2_9CAEN